MRQCIRPGNSAIYGREVHLAEWKVRYEKDNIKLVLGIEEGFSGSRYICRRFAQDSPNITICNSLEETCKQAIKEIFN